MAKAYAYSDLNQNSMAVNFGWYWAQVNCCSYL